MTNKDEYTVELFIRRLKEDKLIIIDLLKSEESDVGKYLNQLAQIKGFGFNSRRRENHYYFCYDKKNRLYIFLDSRSSKIVIYNLNKKERFDEESFSSEDKKMIKEFLLNKSLTTLQFEKEIHKIRGLHRCMWKVLILISCISLVMYWVKFINENTICLIALSLSNVTALQDVSEVYMKRYICGYMKRVWLITGGELFIIFTVIMMIIIVANASENAMVSIFINSVSVVTSIGVLLLKFDQVKH